jgi:hypothetical protein
VAAAGWLIVMTRPGFVFTSGFTALALALATLSPSFAQSAPSALAPSTPASSAPAIDSSSSYVDSCQVADEERFRSEIDRLTFTALETSLQGVDYGSIVRDVWRRQAIDPTLDAQVDKAIAQVIEETSWTTILQSLASREAAEKLAMAVAERTYQSDEVKKAVEQVAAAVGDQLAGRIELATLDAALPAVGCVRAYLGGRYGSAIALMVADDTGKQFQGTVTAGSAEVTNADIAIRSEGLVAGTVILIVRRTLAGMAKRLGQRVVGAVLSRIVSVVAGGIGLVLIAKDIWDLRNGVLPIIEEEMKSPESKEKVRSEIAAAISEQLGTHLKEVSSQTAERIVGIWHEFRQAHAKVIDLTERHVPFKSFIDAVDKTALPKVDRVVALVSEKEGEAGILARLDNGTLSEAVNKLPDPAFDIALDVRSLEDGFAWNRLAGTAIERVKTLNLHRSSKPADFTPASLAALLAVDDDGTIERLAALSAPNRDVLLGLDPNRIKLLTRSLQQSELASFASYLQSLKHDAGLRLMSAVADEPQRMKVFAAAYVQQAVVASRDQEAAIGMLLRTGSLIDAISLQSDAERVWAGDVAPVLLWEKHSWAMTVVGIVAAFLLLVLWRMLPAPRRSRP